MKTTKTGFLKSLKAPSGRTAMKIIAVAVIFVWVTAGLLPSVAQAQTDDPSPPEEVVKLIFVHHSTGENWLTDGYGNLGRTLGENNYFVSDTNYGWGPDGIGDRTDIINWPEWFRGPDSERYMQALFAESGQNSSYTRNLPDPGGENEIIMFKSCFPNSALEGSPNDEPAPGGDSFTVSNAKYIYNDLLNYFSTRPDKLFVVIGTPPLQDPTYADNARAFNNWLVNDWLAENNYPYNNVAVFGFYNVLTHPDSHHYYQDGQIQYIDAGSNTLHYDSDGDDHPNVAGSQKATDEFIPMLNIYYHRWRAGAPAQPPVQATTAPAEPTEAPAVVGEEEPAPVEPGAPPSGDLVDDFEAGAPPASNGWEPYWDAATQTTIQCAPQGDMVHSGVNALHINYNVDANSWATCALTFDQVRDWSTGQGISLYVHANQPAMVFDVIVNSGEPGALTTYQFAVETTPEMVDGWVYLELPWNLILGADWEGDAGNPIDPTRVTGVSIGFDTFPDTPNTGEIWVDDIHLLSMGADAPVSEPVEEPAAPPQATEPGSPPEPGAEQPTAPPAQPTAPPAEPQGEQDSGRSRMCGGPAALALGVIAMALWTRQRGQWM